MDNPWVEPTLDPMVTLDAALSDLRYVTDRVRSWPPRPQESVAAAWAPLLMEKLVRIDQRLESCLHSLRSNPTVPAPTEGNRIVAGMTMADIERVAILQAIRSCRGNRERAAQMLRISPRTLYRKLKSYGE